MFVKIVRMLFFLISESFATLKVSTESAFNYFYNDYSQNRLHIFPIKLNDNEQTIS